MSTTNGATIDVQWIPPTGSTKRGSCVTTVGNVRVPHTFDIVNDSEREKYIDLVMRRCPGLDDEHYREALYARLSEYAADEVMRRGKQLAEDIPERSDATIGNPEAVLADMDKGTVQEAHDALRDPNLSTILIADFEAIGIAGESDLALLTYLIGTSRLLSRPNAAIIRGSSSSGKSYVPDRVAQLFPPEAIMRLTTMTREALIHMEPGSLEHRFILAGERSRMENDFTADIRRSLREMLSSGRLTKAYPQKLDGDGIITRTIEQKGPIAYMESTTRTEVFHEDETRCFLLNTDESAEQTLRILDATARAASSEAGGGDAPPIASRHHAMQRIIATVGTPARVRVPYAELIAARFPRHSVVARRAFPLLLGAIEAHALLHHAQRQRSGNGVIIASEDDYSPVWNLLARPFARALGSRISTDALAVDESLRRAFDMREFSLVDASNATTHPMTTMRRRIDELVAAGLAEVAVEARGRRKASYRLLGSGENRLPRDAAIPTPREVFSR